MSVNCENEKTSYFKIMASILCIFVAINILNVSINAQAGSSNFWCNESFSCVGMSIDITSDSEVPSYDAVEGYGYKSLFGPTTSINVEVNGGVRCRMFLNISRTVFDECIQPYIINRWIILLFWRIIIGCNQHFRL